MERAGKEAAVPDGWRVVRLGDVADVAFSGVDKRTMPEETPVLLCNYTDVFYNQRITPDMDFMPATATDTERERWQLKRGDVLFTKDSETADEIGIPSVVADDMPGVLCGYHLGVARPSPALVDGPFLAAALNSSASRHHFTRVANGVTRFGLTLDAARSVPVLLPPLPEQHAIADVLDSIDASIERTEAVIAATETLRDSLLHELLTRGVPGWHTEWKDVPGIGTIPADWEVVRLGEVAEVAFSSVDKKTVPDEIPVRLCNYTDVFYNRRISPEMQLMEATATTKEIDRWSLRMGDVLFTKDSETADEIGIPAFVEAHMPGVLCGYHLGLARPLANRLEGSFLAEALGSPMLATQFSKAANGVTRFGLTLGATNQLHVSLPPIGEQRVISDLLHGVDGQLREQRAEQDALQSLKESTGNALLTGRVRAMSPKGVHNDTADPAGAACKGGRRSANRLCSGSD